MEIELKLLLAPPDAPRLRAHPLLAQSAQGPLVLQMHDIYVDTPDLQLCRRQAGLRVRQVDGRWVQTLKAGGTVSGGLHSRHEWEGEVPGPQIFTAFVVDGNGATAVTGAPTTLAANAYFKLCYDLATSTWYRIG